MKSFEAKENLGLSEIALEVADHFNVNPPKKDEEFHDWAESRGLDVHKVEQGAYELATVFVKFLYGGRANEKGLEAGDVDSKELEAGTKVEAEHTSDEATAARIALDHEAEFPKDAPLKYYVALNLMERLMKALVKMDKDLAEDKIRQLNELVDSSESEAGVEH